MARASWIWVVGAVVWWIDAAIAVHYGHRAHAVLAVVVALLFFLAGMVGRPKPTKPSP